ncbi:hypothetical protein ABZ614_39500 [Streptomyces sp. NPDC013178]|uniref:hypothetical protein n=1 Tax=Streptomyces sp. NPDC013178 TaxID=3155118 RepID=UPI0033EB2B86
MAWEEWEQLKADTAESRSTQMQLNQLSAEGGGGGGERDLVVNQDDLGAVGHDAYTLYEDLHSGTDIAGAGMNKDGAGSTMQAAASLKSHGFEMGNAMELTVEVWTSQANTVLQACAHISNHLDFSKKLHSQDDAEIAAVIRDRGGSALSVSEINKYFQ